MGQRKSKPKKRSYDVTPVVSNRDLKIESNQNNTVKAENQSKLPQPVTAPTTVFTASTAIQEDAKKPFDPKDLPTWLTAPIFVDILREHFEDFERIANFKAYPALSAGENYATLMLRVSIDVELKDGYNRNMSFMLKVPHESEQMKQMLSIANYFVTENEMYSVVMPEFEQMYKAAGLEIEFGPKAYRLPKDIDPNYVLLQDLRPFGFHNANRQECLDMVHAKSVLRKLAQFHAASATRVATKGPYINELMNGLFTGKPESAAIFDAMIGSFRTAFLNNINNYKDGEKYEPDLKYYLENMAEVFENLAFYNEDEFNVLNHGDCWSNNILFKYNDAGEMIDMEFVDLQMSKYGSPAQDLYYFIFSSLQIDIKLKEFDYFIRFYYDNLIESLKLLNYPKKLPILREIYIQLFKYGTWTLSTTIITLPIVLLDPTEIASMDNFVSSSEDGLAFKNALFSNKRYHQHINEILPWLYNRGLLEPYSYPGNPSPTTNTVASEAVEKTAEPTLANQPLFEAPKWVTQFIFIDLLKQNFEGFKIIKNFKVSPGTGGGDNYASLLLKIDIDMELEHQNTKSASFMMKVPLSSEEVSAMMDSMNVFDKEISMYHEFLPKFEEIYKKADVDITFGPKYFDLTEKPVKDIILLENLRPLGFENCNRLEGLDEEHTKAVLRKIAAFHAASALYAHEKDFPATLVKGMYCEEQRELYEKMGDVFLPLFNECVKTYDGHEEYYYKVVAGGKTFFDSALKASDIQKNYLNVLNHGDLWTNNILFKHDQNGKIESTYLIDYQIEQYGSPAIDLYYFLLSSPQFEIKLEKFDYFVKYYYDHLVENLKLLKYPKYIPTLKELHIEMLQKGAFAFSTSTGVLSAVLLDPSEHASMENMLSEESVGVDFRRQLYINPRYKKHAEAIFPWLNRRGLLDDIICNVEEKQADYGCLFVIPEWLNKDYLTGVLQTYFDEFSKILELNTEIATKIGDNYASLVVKADINAEMKGGSAKLFNFIFKIPPTGEQAKFLMETWNSFKKEIMLYHEYIPEFEFMYKRAGHAVKFGPRYFRYQSDIGTEVVILENLQNDDFKIADRLQGLDMEHTKCVLRKMAQFHAASVKRIEIGGSYPSYFYDGMYNERSRLMFEQIMGGTNASILKATHTYVNNNEYLGKMQHLVDTFLDKAIELNKVCSTDFNVLNHGDCWVNNIMFQYDEAGNIKETLFIDFQDCKYGSPANDLYYFLISSTHIDIKVDQFEYFINYYHEQLLENFKLLDYKGKIPKLEELHADLLKYGFLGLSAVWGITSLCLLEPSENSTIENIIDDTETRNNMFTNPRYKACAEKVLLWLSRRGSLDY